MHRALALITLLLPVSTAVPRPILVWPTAKAKSGGEGSGSGGKGKKLIPEPVPNFPRSYSSNVRIFLDIPGRGNVTMEGYAAADGVIGYARTSVFERVTPVDQPTQTFPETQINNQNRMTTSYLRKSSGGDDVVCTVSPMPPPPPAPPP
eukprot:COSAG01_NODE_22168_length_868_cov_1.561769_1_plen_148_part_01